MPTNYRRMMQEQLDGDLDPQTETMLDAQLQENKDAAEEFAKLETLHQTLAMAPAMRAPSRLAATIMAKLAKRIKAQTQMAPMPEDVQLALMLTSSLVQMMMMPTMLAASYMVLNAQYSPQVLTRVIERTIALNVMMIDGLVVLYEEVEQMISKDPEMAPIAMTLIPTALLGMIDYIQNEQKEIDKGVV